MSALVNAVAPLPAFSGMEEAFVDLVRDAVGSPWLYAALFAFAALDGIFPLVPSESLVITASVFAVDGDPSLPLIVASAAAGAFVGDHFSYAVGRTFGQRGRLGRRRQAALKRADAVLAERGGLILVVCRYIPGLRTAITLTAGAVRYPLTRFTPFDALAAISWAMYGAAIGYIGGSAFEEDPIKGLALGLGLALTVTLVVEAVRRLRRPRRVAS